MDLPSARMVLKAPRSRASAIAFLISSLSNGGAPGLTIRLMVLFDGTNWHTAFGALAVTSLSPATVMSDTNVRSMSPDMKASTRVERLSITRYSMPSSSGRPFFQ